jgi:hypothetical protein
MLGMGRQPPRGGYCWEECSETLLLRFDKFCDVQMMW